MKISEATMGVLRNFSDINNNILFKPGKSIATMSTMKNIMAISEAHSQWHPLHDTQNDTQHWHTYTYTHKRCIKTFYFFIPFY